MSHFVIVGGGQAGVSAAAKLRELDQDAEITLICAEPALPYQRPPLSKKYLTGEMPMDRLVLRPDSWFEQQNISVVLGCAVSNIDPAAKTLTHSDKLQVAFDKLLLTTGTMPRRLPDTIGGNLPGVFYLRSSEDSDRIRPALEEGKRLVVIGGGYIGLEVAAVARQKGLDVTIVEMAPRILQRVACEETSNFFRELHTSRGVAVIENSAVDRIVEQNGTANGVLLADGKQLPADLVLVGVGVLPVTDIAESAGLKLGNGIVVDEHCQTSATDIYSAGDCAEFDYHGARLRIESVPHAIHQAEVAASNMVGKPESYSAKPWFWSDQYEVKLQIAGLNTGYTDVVTRPGKREGAQSIWYYKDDILLAVDAMNDAPAFMMSRRIIEAGKSVPKAVAADPTSDLKALV